MRAGGGLGASAMLALPIRFCEGDSARSLQHDSSFRIKCLKRIAIREFGQSVVRSAVRHDSKITRSVPPGDGPRMGLPSTFLLLLAGIVGLDLIGSISPRLALLVAGSLILLAAVFFVSALVRKD